MAKKFMEKKEEGGYPNFPSKSFCLTFPKKSVGEPFCLSSISAIEFIYASEGNVTIIRRKVFVSQYRNIS